MYRNNKLSLAVSVAIGVSFSGIANAELEEVIVTATKRAENMQDVPIAISALGGDSLKELNVQTFDEYVQYLPNVVSAGIGPGSREIYIRGSASEQGSVTVTSAQGSAPGVALYLDEQPVSFGGRNLDLYAADLQRVEVLAGPQGTLFGASSQSGTVRMITNKPVIGEFEGRVDLGISTTSGGDNSNKMEAMINLPLGENVAMRLVGFSDNQGPRADISTTLPVPSRRAARWSIETSSMAMAPALINVQTLPWSRPIMPHLLKRTGMKLHITDSVLGLQLISMKTGAFWSSTPLRSLMLRALS